MLCKFEIWYTAVSTKVVHEKPKALFTWRQGALANWATRLGVLKHSPPLHATHLREIVASRSSGR